MRLPWPPHYYPDDVARHATQNGVVAVHVDDLKRWQEKMSDAFDLGFKAAGGTMIPDGARDSIELALPRDAVDELATLIEGSIPKSPGLRQLLENISIYRSRK